MFYRHAHAVASTCGSAQVSFQCQRGKTCMPPAFLRVQRVFVSTDRKPGSLALVFRGLGKWAFDTQALLSALGLNAVSSLLSLPHDMSQHQMGGCSASTAKLFGCAMLTGGMADGILGCLRPSRKRAVLALDGRQCRSMANHIASPQPCAAHLAGLGASGGGIDDMHYSRFNTCCSNWAQSMGICNIHVHVDGFAGLLMAVYSKVS